MSRPLTAAALWRKRVRRRLRAWRGDPVAQILALPPGDDGMACYERIRRRGDLIGSPGRRFLVTASYEVCDAVLRSADFGAAPTGLRSRDIPPEPPYRGLIAHPVDDSLMGMDPPRHTVVRRLLVPWFTSRAQERLRPRLEAIVDGCLDRVAGRHTPWDLVQEYAARIPAETIGAILGLPPSDADRLASWGAEFVAILDGARTTREDDRLRHVLTDMCAYLTRLCDERRRNPRDDLLSALATSRELTPREKLATAEALCIAGFETTTDLICGAVIALDRHPDQRNLFTAYPGRTAGLIDETLRYTSPVHYVLRSAVRDTTMAGRAIRAGTPVILLLAGANRDPRVFPDPARFDITRENARAHLAFSAGPHYCIGASLARLEGGVAIPALYQRYPKLALAGPVVPRNSRILRGPGTVPVMA